LEMIQSLGFGIARSPEDK